MIEMPNITESLQQRCNTMVTGRYRRCALQPPPVQAVAAWSLSITTNAHRGRTGCHARGKSGSRHRGAQGSRGSKV